MMKWLEQLQASLAPYPWAYSAIVAGVLILTAFLVNWITKRILLRGLTRILRALPSGESEEGKVRLAIISRLANIVPALVLAYGAVAIPDVHDTLETIIRNVCIAFIVLTTALALGKLLDLVEIAYRRRPDAPNKPIKGYLQLGKIVVFTVATILIVATLINRNPLILLSGPGSDKYVELAGKLLKQGVDALFCPGGNAGIVMLYAFSLYGRRVPEDISLIASEQTFFSHYAVPPQTTISPDYAAMAAATADIIEARLDGQKAPVRTVLPYNLILRESVAAARKS